MLKYVFAYSRRILNRQPMFFPSNSLVKKAPLKEKIKTFLRLKVLKNRNLDLDKFPRQVKFWCPLITSAIFEYYNRTFAAAIEKVGNK